MNDRWAEWRLLTGEAAALIADMDREWWRLRLNRARRARVQVLIAQAAAERDKVTKSSSASSTGTSLTLRSSSSSPHSNRTPSGRTSAHVSFS